jgi:hypothetical protein
VTPEQKIIITTADEIKMAKKQGPIENKDLIDLTTWFGPLSIFSFGPPLIDI